jgi:hypothetical protein
LLVIGIWRDEPWLAQGEDDRNDQSAHAGHGDGAAS